MNRNAWGAIALLMCALPGAWAALAAAPSIPAGVQPVISHASGYDTVNYKLSSGTSVTEYANGQGMVFAVAWSGPVLPDLNALLGEHFGDFKKRAASRPGGPHTPVRLARQDLQVISRGHMGALRGAAWLPPLLPAGFNTGALQ